MNTYNGKWSRFFKPVERLRNGRFAEKAKAFLEKNEGNKIFYLRLALLILAFDLFAVMVLADISPFKLVNPVRFLKKPPVDSRLQLKLYYPKSNQARQSMLEDYKPTEEGAKEQKPVFPDDYIVLSVERVMQAGISESKQKKRNRQNMDTENEGSVDSANSANDATPDAAMENASYKMQEENISYIMGRLAQDPASLSGRKLYHDKTMIKKIWVHEKQAILHLESRPFEGMTRQEILLFKTCVTRSILENTSGVNGVSFVFD